MNRILLLLKSWMVIALAIISVGSFAWSARTESGVLPSHSSSEMLMFTGANGDSGTAATRAAIERFNDAFNRHDVDAVMEAMTEDCVFENTSPFPDGTRYAGCAAVREYWVRFFQSSPTAHFDAEELIVTGDRCVVRWVYTKVKDGKPWHIRGVDVFRVRDGKVSEKLSYVKG